MNVSQLKDTFRTLIFLKNFSEKGILGLCIIIAQELLDDRFLNEDRVSRQLNAAFLPNFCYCFISAAFFDIAIFYPIAVL